MDLIELTSKHTFSFQLIIDLWILIDDFGMLTMDVKGTHVSFFLSFCLYVLTSVEDIRRGSVYKSKSSSGLWYREKCELVIGFECWDLPVASWWLCFDCLGN